MIAPADVTIAIPTYESDPRLLGGVLALAAAQSAHPVVVADMSRTNAVARVAASLEEVDYLALPDSQGVSQSRNACVARAATRYVLFLDSDATPEAGWASAMRAGFEQDSVAIVGARVLPAWEQPPPRLFTTATASDWLSMFDLGHVSRTVPRVMGTSYAVDRTRVGDPPFDERLGRRPGVQLAHEEVELALQTRQSGWRCWYAADAVVRHHIPPARATWRWMVRRAHTAGREIQLHPAHGLEPLPREPRPADYVFRALVAPAFVSGRLRGVGR